MYVHLHNHIDTHGQDATQNATRVLLYGCSMLMLIMFIQLIAVWGGAQTWHAWFSLLIYVSFCVVSYKETRLFFSLFFLFFLGQGTAIASCAYLEFGNYISEQVIFAYATGATSRLVMYNLVFFLSSLTIFVLVSKKYGFEYAELHNISNALKAVVGALILLLVILFAGQYVYGAPFLQGFDRFTYWLDHPMPILRTLGGQLYFVTFLLGILYSRTKQKLLLVLLLVACLYMVLNSEKFSGLLTIGYLFVLPLVIHRLSKGNMSLPLTRLGIYGLIICTSFFALSYYHYSQINISSESSVVESMTNRALGLQGHVWWGTDTEVMARNSAINDKQLAKEVAALLSLSSESQDVGMKHLMTLVAPATIVNTYLQRNVNFTMGYPAIGLQVFGYIGLLLLQVVAAAIVSASTFYLYRKVIACQLIRGAIAVKLFIAIYAAFTMGNFYQLTSTKVMFFLFLIIVVESSIYVSRRRTIA